MSDPRLPKGMLAAATVLLLLAAPGLAGTGSSNAANKAAAAGSEVEFLSVGEPGITILQTSIKTSPPQDLLFSVTLECALWTNVVTLGNEVSEARARVRAWVEIDGAPVPVGADDVTETGKVVFCDRLHRQSVMDLDDENARIEQYLATRTANAFNWALPDVGGGVHLIEVKAEVVTETSGGDAFAEAGIGHRTLIVEPIHMAQGATVDNTAANDAGGDSFGASLGPSEPIPVGEPEDGGLLDWLTGLI
jgi:hypothetical protein